jgi:hypothetical protein
MEDRSSQKRSEDLTSGFEDFERYLRREHRRIEVVGN